MHSVLLGLFIIESSTCISEDSCRSIADGERKFSNHSHPKQSLTHVRQANTCVLYYVGINLSSNLVQSTILITCLSQALLRITTMTR